MKYMYQNKKCRMLPRISWYTERDLYHTHAKLLYIFQFSFFSSRIKYLNYILMQYLIRIPHI